MSQTTPGFTIWNLRCSHWRVFRLYDINGALWNICLMHCWICAIGLLDPSYKSSNLLDPYPTMLHFVTEMCTCRVHISVTRWCIVGHRTGALWELHNKSINRNVVILTEFLLLAAAEVVMLTFSGLASDENFNTMASSISLCGFVVSFYFGCEVILNDIGKIRDDYNIAIPGNRSHQTAPNLYKFYGIYNAAMYFVDL